MTNYKIQRDWLIELLQRTQPVLAHPSQWSPAQRGQLHAEITDRLGEIVNERAYRMKGTL